MHRAASGGQKAAQKPDANTNEVEIDISTNPKVIP